MDGRRTIQARVGSLKWIVGFLALFALLIPHPAWMVLLVVLGGLWLGSFVWMRALLRGISAERQQQSNWVAIGDTLIEQFKIENRSWFPAPYIEIADSSNVPNYRASFVVTIGRNTTQQWQHKALCTRRGRFQLGPWSLKIGDVFGLYEVTIAYDQIAEIVIYPPILTNLPISLPAGKSEGQLPRRQHSWQAQINAAGVRHFRPNDPHRHIHWPTSARRNALFVREFEQDAAGDIWLVPDLSADNQVGRDRDSTEEHAILLATSLMAQGLYERRAVGLAAYGETPHIVPPSQGTQQRWRLLEALAMVSSAKSTSLQATLRDVRHIVQRGSAVLLITATDSAEWLPDLFHLHQSGVAVSIVLFDRRTFGAFSNTHILQQQLLRMGFSCSVLERYVLQRRLNQLIR